MARLRSTGSADSSGSPHAGRATSSVKSAGSLAVSLVTGGCVLALTIIAKYGLNAELDFISQYAPVWVFSAYLGTKHRRGQAHTRSSTLFWILAIVAATAGVLAVHALRS